MHERKNWGVKPGKSEKYDCTSEDNQTMPRSGRPQHRRLGVPEGTTPQAITAQYTGANKHWRKANTMKDETGEDTFGRGRERHAPLHVIPAGFETFDVASRTTMSR